MFMQTARCFIFLFCFFFSSLFSYQIGVHSLENSYGDGSLNQDRFTVREFSFDQAEKKDLFFGVFDGHGRTSDVSEHLSSRSFDAFCDHYLFENSFNVQDALRKSFEQLGSECLRLNGGSTAVAGYIKDGTLHLANVGDSRAVLCRNGKAIPLTMDHVPNPGSKEYKRIVENGGNIYARIQVIDSFSKSIYSFEVKRFFSSRNIFDYLQMIKLGDSFHRIIDSHFSKDYISDCLNVFCRTKNKKFLKPFFGREFTVFEEWFVLDPSVTKERGFLSWLGMSRAFGDSAYSPAGVNYEPDLFEERLQPEDDFLIIASDGLWKAFDQFANDNQEIVNFVNVCRCKGLGVQEITERLSAQARLLESFDDITIILIMLEPGDLAS